MTADEAERVLTELFDASFDAFVRYTYRHAGRVEFAEDLVQEAFLDLFRELRAGKTIVRPKAWMLRVLHRKLGREWRKRSDRLERLDILETMPGPSLHVDPSGADVGDLNRMLSVLSPREQEVVLLRMQSLKYREIGGLLGISANTVNTLLIRALRKLQARMTGGQTVEHGQRHVETNASKTLQ